MYRTFMGALMKRIPYKKIYIFLVLAMLISMVSPVMHFSAKTDEVPYQTYTYDRWGNANPAPNGYLPYRSIKGSDYGLDEFLSPEDLFYCRERGEVYIVDTGRQRIVVVDEDFNLVRVITELRIDNGTFTFMKPTGIFVEDDGTMYVADQDRGMVVKFNQELDVLTLIGKPESDLITEDFDYKPNKVVVDTYGKIYVQAMGIFQGIINMRPDGTFIKYYGANKVEMTARRVMLKMFKIILGDTVGQSMETFNPIEYGNLYLARNDFIYAVAAATQNNRQMINKLNPLGIDIFGSPLRLRLVSSFTDVTVDEDELLTLTDLKTGMVYQVDKSGEMLFAFGGIGEQLGLFKRTTAVIEVNERLYVLDGDKNDITCFMLTDFGMRVREATRLYNKGMYQDSIGPWMEVIKLNANFLPAYTGIGKAYYQIEDYKEAMYYFKLANNKPNYSDAFKEYSLSVMRENFVFVVFVVLSLFIIYKVLRKVMSSSTRKLNPNMRKDVSTFVSSDYITNSNMEVQYGSKNKLLRDLKYLKYTMFHPVNGMYRIKWDNRGSIGIGVAIMSLFFIVNVFEAVLKGFIYNTQNTDRISVPSIFAVSIGGILLWFISNWAISSLMFTEGKLAHIFVLTCYSLMPYCVMALVYIFLSNFFTMDLLPFLTMIRVAGIAWSAIVLFFGTYQIHQLTVGKVLVNLLLTVFGVLIMLFVMLLGYSLLQQMYIFVYTLFSEVMFRV